MSTKNPYQTPRSSCDVEFLKIENKVRIRLMIFLAVLFWIIALFLPAIEYRMIGSGSRADASGLNCFYYTVIPWLWIFFPQFFLPLSLANIGFFVSVTKLTRNPNLSIPKWLLYWNIGMVPCALSTLTVATKLYIGFYLWLGALIIVACTVVIRKIGGQAK